MKMQAWIIERRVKLLTDPALADEDDVRTLMGDVDSDAAMIVLEDELVISKAQLEFQEFQEPAKPQKAKKQASTRKALPPPPRAMSTAELSCPECGAPFKYAKARDSHVARKHAVEASARNGSARDTRETDRATKPHKCEQCGKGFMNAAGLGSHRALAHPAPKSAKVSPLPLRRDGGNMVTLDKVCISCSKPFVTTSKSKTLCDACFYTSGAKRPSPV